MGFTLDLVMRHFGRAILVDTKCHSRFLLLFDLNLLKYLRSSKCHWFQRRGDLRPTMKLKAVDTYLSTQVVVPLI